VTARQLYDVLAAMVAAKSDALDREVVVRVGIVDDDDDEIHTGGLRSAIEDFGCTDENALVLDADQEPEDDA